MILLVLIVIMLVNLADDHSCAIKRSYILLLLHMLIENHTSLVSVCAFLAHYLNITCVAYTSNVQVLYYHDQYPQNIFFLQ